MAAEAEAEGNSAMVLYSVLFALALGTLSPVLCVAIAFPWHRSARRRGSDRPSYASAFKFFASLTDFYTDCIWALLLYSEGSSLWLYAAVATLAPHALSIALCLVFLTRWKQMASAPHVAGFAKRYDKVLILLTVFSGFYAAMELLTSHLLHASLLSFQMPRAHAAQVANLKLVNEVLLENLPCLVIQLVHLTRGAFAFDVQNSDELVTLITMAFSLLSIVFGLLTLAQKAATRCMATSAGEGEGDGRFALSVGFTLRAHGGVIGEHHAHTHFLLQRSLSRALQLEPTQIAIDSVQRITDGVKVSAELASLSEQEAHKLQTALRDECSAADAQLRANLKRECVDHLKLARARAHAAAPGTPSMSRNCSASRSRADLVRNTDSSRAPQEEAVWLKVLFVQLKLRDVGGKRAMRKRERMMSLSQSHTNTSRRATDATDATNTPTATGNEMELDIDIDAAVAQIEEEDGDGDGVGKMPTVAVAVGLGSKGAQRGRLELAEWSSRIHSVDKETVQELENNLAKRRMQLLKVNSSTHMPHHSI